jgi:hypothetical protein
MHQFLTKKHMMHVPKYDILLQIIQVFEPTLNSIKTERRRKPKSNTTSEKKKTTANQAWKKKVCKQRMKTAKKH